MLLHNMISTPIEFQEDNLLSFITLSIDQKYILCGGFDKRLHVIDTDTLIKKDYALKYYAYCCFRYGSQIFIGGMDFIQIFDTKSMKVTTTVTVGKLIYKIIPVDAHFLLCGGSYILQLLRITDNTLIEICKFDTTIYDMCKI
jgi:hypothetical protein